MVFMLKYHPNFDGRNLFFALLHVCSKSYSMGYFGLMWFLLNQQHSLRVGIVHVNAIPYYSNSMECLHNMENSNPSTPVAWVLTSHFTSLEDWPTTCMIRSFHCDHFSSTGWILRSRCWALDKEYHGTINEMDI